jgi:hypothetical protein
MTRPLKGLTHKELGDILLERATALQQELNMAASAPGLDDVEGKAARIQDCLDEVRLRIPK